MPFGYLITAVLVALLAVVAVAPPMPESSSRWNWAFVFGFLPNELPFVAAAWLALSTALTADGGDLWTPVGLVSLAVAAVAWIVLAVVARRGLATRSHLRATLEHQLPGSGVQMPASHPWWRILVAPLSFRGRSIGRQANIAYGPHGRRNRLDVHVPRRGATGPVLVYFHGGGFRSGHKNREAKPLLHRLGRRGWLCISANYRLEPRAGYPDFLVDARRALAWVRQHASAYGADPERVWLAGSSAGGYLATMTGLGGAASLVPGPDDGAPPGSPIEGVIGLYAFYGSPGAPADVAASPGDHIHRAAPPMFLAHGDRDTIVLVDDARTFAGRLAATSDSPVVYAELPGGQHGFDLFRSARFEAVVDAIEIFVDRVGRQRSGGQASACSGGEPGGDEAGAE